MKELISLFNERYPNGSIASQRVITEEINVEVFKTTVIPDCSKPERSFISYGFASRDGELAEDHSIERALNLLMR